MAATLRNDEDFIQMIAEEIGFSQEFIRERVDWLIGQQGLDIFTMFQQQFQQEWEEHQKEKK
jgi:hypothetical protein